MDDFDVDHAYQTTDHRVVIADDTAMFTDFAASTDTVFTRGDADTIRFAERPMWLRVDTSGAESVSIEAHDATNDGQAILVDASWLESHGVEGEPLAYYHDGTTIPVEPTTDGTAYRIEAPHFSHIRITTVDLGTSWKTEGHTREFLADGPTDSGTFNVTVSAVTDGTIEFRFWSVQNGSTNVFDGDETFQKVGRESLDRSGYYTPNFINETNLANGYTTLGRERFELVDVNLTASTYDFSDGNVTYQFDDTTGFLERVHDARNDATIDMLGVRTDPVPASHAGAVPRVALVALDLDYEAGYYESADELTARRTVDWNDCCDPEDNGANQEVLGNPLLDHTTVIVESPYDLLVWIRTPKDDPCMNRTDCHTRAAFTQNDNDGDADTTCEDFDICKFWKFVVDFDDGPAWSRSELISCPGDCTWDSNDEVFEASAQFELTLKGVVDHGILATSKVPFWNCGQAVAWDTSGTRAEEPWGDKSDRCDANQRANHGWIIVDPVEPIY